MPTGLRRYQQEGHLHFLSINCFRKRDIFASEEPRGTFLSILEAARRKYRFLVLGYVVMPTHVLLLLSEPEEALLSVAVQVIKQRFSRSRIESEVWERRYYDFNVYTRDKQIEKLLYMHDNPLRAGLVHTAAEWKWSSYRAYAFSEPGPVFVATDTDTRFARTPPFRNKTTKG